MKAKPIEQSRKAQKSKLGLKEKPRMALEQSRKTKKKKKTQETYSFGTCFHNNFQFKFQNQDWSPKYKAQK